MTLPARMALISYLGGVLTVLTGLAINYAIDNPSHGNWIPAFSSGTITMVLSWSTFVYCAELEQVRNERDEALETVRHLSWVSALFMRHLAQMDGALKKQVRSPNSTVKLSRIELLLRETRFWQWVNLTLDPGFDESAMTHHEAARFLSGYTHRFEEGLPLTCYRLRDDVQRLYQACERSAGDALHQVTMLFRAKPPSSPMRDARYALSELAWHLCRHLPAHTVQNLIRVTPARSLAWLARQEGTPESPHTNILMQHVAQGATEREEDQVSA